MPPLDIYCARCVGAKTRVRITISTDSPKRVNVNQAVVCGFELN